MFSAVVRKQADPSFQITFNIEESAVPRKGDYLTFKGLDDMFVVDYIIWSYEAKSPTTLDHAVQVNIYVKVY